MRILTSADANFDQQLTDLLAFETVNDKGLLETVDNIIHQVRQTGDKAVLELTQKFDSHPATSMQDLMLTQNELKAAYDALEDPIKSSLDTAAERIKSFHQ